MALSINGTTGISGVDGSASAPALQGTDSNTGINFASDTVNINTGGSTRATIDSAGALDVPTTFPIKVNGSEKLRIDSTGKLGLGITPTRPLHIASDEDLTSLTGTTKGAFCISNSDYASGDYSAIDFTYTGSDHPLARIGTKITGAGTSLSFGTSNNYSNGVTNEALVINQDGRVKINTTSNVSNSFIEQFAIDSGTTGGYASAIGGNTSGGYSLLYMKSGTNMSTFIHFTRYSDYASGSPSFVGSITTNGSATAFNTSSDYRLKENAVAISDGITRLKTLKPYRFNWKIDSGTTVDGFFAHEVTAVPEAVTGTKDEVSTDEDGAIPKGDPIYQSIDQSKLVPLLTAALQEAIAKIETLETKVAALEAG